MLEKKELEVLIEIAIEKKEAEMWAEPGHEEMDEEEYNELLKLIEKLERLIASM